ncbi:MAG: glycosyltransferase family 9 protein [Pseudomonadota bacterium]
MVTQNNQVVRLLIVRNDKLGDFMLAWPVFSLLKKHWPKLHITVLVPPYTKTIAEFCPWVDDILLDEGEDAIALARQFKRQPFDAMLTLFSTNRTAFSGWLSRIPYRLAPATKFAQFFYTNRLTQRRSRSEKPEYAYNIDLAYQLLADFGKLEPRKTTVDKLGDFLPAEICRPLLRPTSEQQRSHFAKTRQLDEDALWIALHPGSGGSANNLSAQQYVQLACEIHCTKSLVFIITAGPGEEGAAEQVAHEIRRGGGTAVAQASGKINLLIATLQWADLFISNSTGPLHIAAALDRPTAAFYPRHRSATPLRWQTLNAPHKRLAFTPPPEGVAEDVSAIDVTAAASTISEFLVSLIDRVR